MRTDQRFHHTGFESPITEVALIVYGAGEGRHAALGTAVMIGTGIAITAKHVIDEYLLQYHDLRQDSDWTKHKFFLQVTQFIELGKKAWFWSVNEIYMANDEYTDVAFLRLQPTVNEQREHIFKIPKIQLTPPSIGSEIHAFGYSFSSVSQTEKQIEIGTKPYSTHGVVEQIYPIKRDSVILPFPCFQTNARFDPGMSGGPVFTKDGLLCGLICNSLLPDEDHPDHHTTHVVSLYPMLGIPVAYIREGKEAGYYPAYDLALDKYITIIDLDKLSIMLNIDGTYTTVMRLVGSELKL